MKASDYVINHLVHALELGKAEFLEFGAVHFVREVVPFSDVEHLEAFSCTSSEHLPTPSQR